MTGIIVEIKGIENADVLEFYTKNGKLMCDVEFTDNEVEWKRPVVVGGDTGISYGCGEMGGSVSCGGVTVGYKKVKDIPKNFGTNIYIGTTERVVGYEYITEEMIKNLTSYEVEPMEMSLLAQQGERFVIAIPYDWELKAYKDNGFGGRVPFSETVMGANGNIEVEIDGVRHKIYGEFFTTTGNTKIYIG